MQPNDIIFSCGKLDNGTDQDVNGDTLFEIGSITKTFTGLLLQEMVERGQAKLDDPVAKYLPESVKMPTCNGKQITLLQLATHTSALPDMPDNVDPKRAEDPGADYSAQKLHAFLSYCKLAREPGAKYEYSSLGMTLLAHAIALKAGVSYESLVTDRICRPLKMDSTRITLTPEMNARMARGHNYFGYPASSTHWGLDGGSGLRSTANDLLKYLSANLGLTPCGLTSYMEKTHVAHYHAHLQTETGVDTDIGLAWMITHEPGAASFIQHGGLTRGFITFIGLNMARRRGVVVLCNSQDFDVAPIGRILLESEWQLDRRPTERKISGKAYGAFVGQYKSLLKPVPGAPSERGIGIRREGDRLFVQIMGPSSWPVHVLLPPIADELLSQSGDVFFERLSGVSVTFSRDAQGNVTGFAGNYHGKAFSYEKISDQPPNPPEPLKPCVAIQLDTTHLDVCVGHYEFAPDSAYPTGMKLAIWREGNRLLGQMSGENTLQGVFAVSPASETEFFISVDGAQLTFIKNDSGEATAVIHHYPGSKKSVGKRAT